MKKFLLLTALFAAHPASAMLTKTLKFKSLPKQLLLTQAFSTSNFDNKESNNTITKKHTKMLC